MIMSDLWDQISEIADLNKVKHLLSISRSPGKVGPGGYLILILCYNHPPDTLLRTYDLLFY